MTHLYSTVCIILNCLKLPETHPIFDEALPAGPCYIPREGNTQNHWAPRKVDITKVGQHRFWSLYDKVRTSERNNRKD